MKTSATTYTDERNNICPRCKGQFMCNVKEGCWCEQVQVSRDTLKKLRQDYIDCLCEKCLKLLESTKN